MVSSKFQDCLQDVYFGEHAGEAAFEVMLARAEDTEQHYVLGTLLQAETEGKALMRPLVSRLGLPLLDQGGSSAGGASAAEQLNALPWRDRFAALAETVRTNYLPRYEELASLVTHDEDPEAAKIADFMGIHERTLIAVSENIVKGVADPAAPLAAILHFPLARPG